MAERFFVRAGEPREAVDMYTRANMYEAAHKVGIHSLSPHIFVCVCVLTSGYYFVGCYKSHPYLVGILQNYTAICVVYLLQLAVRCMPPDEVTSLYTVQAREFESQGRYKEAERYIFLELFYFG